MSFEINGYLGIEINEITNDIYCEHNDIFEFCEYINKIAQSIK